MFKTHWCRVVHICVSKLTFIGSDNGLSPGGHQAIIWINDGILLTGTLGTNFSEILSEIHAFHSRNAFENVVCEMAAILPRHQCVKFIVTLISADELALSGAMSFAGTVMTWNFGWGQILQMYIEGVKTWGALKYYKKESKRWENLGVQVLQKSGEMRKMGHVHHHHHHNHHHHHHTHTPFSRLTCRKKLSPPPPPPPPSIPHVFTRRNNNNNKKNPQKITIIFFSYVENRTHLFSYTFALLHLGLSHSNTQSLWLRIKEPRRISANKLPEFTKNFCDHWTKTKQNKHQVHILWKILLLWNIASLVSDRYVYTYIWATPNLQYIANF